MQPSLRRLAASALSEVASSQSTAAATVAALKTPKPSEIAGFYPKKRVIKDLLGVFLDYALAPSAGAARGENGFPGLEALRCLLSVQRAPYRICSVVRRRPLIPRVGPEPRYYFRNSVENKYKELADNAKLARMDSEQVGC